MNVFLVVCGILVIWTVVGYLVALLFGKMCAFGNGKHTMPEERYYRGDTFTGGTDESDVGQILCSS